MKFILLFTVLLLKVAIVPVAAQTDTTVYNYAKPLFDFDLVKPVFKLNKEQQANKSRFLRFSVLTGYREGVEPVQGQANFIAIPDAETGTRRFCMLNLSIMDMLTHGFYKLDKVILEVKDSSKYAYDPKYGNEQEWLKRNGYCFEFSLPSTAINGVKTLDQELAHVFGVKCIREKRMKDALVLVRTSSIDKIKSKGQGPREYDMNGNFNNIEITGGRFGHALYEAGMPIVVDETGYKDLVDMQLNIQDWTNLPEVRKALQRYDLDLKPAERELDVFVIRENDWTPNSQKP